MILNLRAWKSAIRFGDELSESDALSGPKNRNKL
jgi:hypothetical protein